jgi:predicted TIM-barrel fold metal-dependent hydrolase
LATGTEGVARPGGGAIDGWVNVTMGDQIPPEFLKRVKEDYLKRGDEFFTSYEPDELLPIMDGLGVDRALIAHSPGEKTGRPLRFVTEHPDRFKLAVHVNPKKLMRDVWALEDIVAEHPVACAAVVPFSIDLPPDDALYYPLYAKCTELDLPIRVNTGLPGPPVPGECQHPIHLDRICHRFGDLRVCMAHGADPWWDVAIRLMIKWKNLSLMTSAYSPKRLPDEVVHFMNTRGQDKIIFASDHPALGMERCITEARALDLADGVLDKYLRTNAERLFWADRNPPR